MTYTFCHNYTCRYTLSPYVILPYKTFQPVASVLKPIRIPSRVQQFPTTNPSLQTHSLPFSIPTLPKETSHHQEPNFFLQSSHQKTVARVASSRFFFFFFFLKIFFSSAFTLIYKKNFFSTFSLSNFLFNSSSKHLSHV